MPSDRIFFSRLRVFPTHSASLLDSSTTALVLAVYQTTDNLRAFLDDTQHANFNSSVVSLIKKSAGFLFCICEILRR